MTQVSDLTYEPMPQYKALPMHGSFLSYLAFFIEVAKENEEAAKAELEDMADVPQVYRDQYDEVLEIVAACKAHPAAFVFKPSDTPIAGVHVSTKEAIPYEDPAPLEYLNLFSLPLFQSRLKTLCAPKAGVEPFGSGVCE